jgi:formate hydrogenlyase subunit 3/multisubunit Na+/H+ antiporter MnhD subunit
MAGLLLFPIVAPILIGFVCLLTPKRARGLREGLTLLTLLGTAASAVMIFLRVVPPIHIEWLRLAPQLTLAFDLESTPFARLTLVVVSAFGCLAALYSIPLMSAHARHREYYAYYLVALGVTAGAVLSANLLLLLFFWELHGFLLFLMAGLNGQRAVRATTRTLLLAGCGDLALLLALGLIWVQGGSLYMGALGDSVPLPNTWLAGASFVLIVAGAAVKIGVMPVHSWAIAISTETPMTVMAYFTSLDKMLGFYLLTMTSLTIFDLSGWRGWALMSVGAVTLLGGVLMAMIQRDYRKMLAFHSVSQMGYAVMGIGTATTIGIIGGLFHLLNMVIVKGSLYLCGASVERATGKTDFSALGGLARAMPRTFLATAVAALAIAGVPPLNAFVSKWLLYQGVLERGGAAFPVFLFIAMAGSALTLASFMKMLYSMFWGDLPAELKDVKESPWTMTLPVLVLALAAGGFGVFYRWPVDTLISPILGLRLEPPGLWQSGTAAVLMVVSLLAGLLVYAAGSPRRRTEADVFLGGEAMDPSRYRVPGTHFYGPVKAMRGLREVYVAAESGALDLYLISCRATKRVSHWVYKYIDQALADFYQEIIPALWSLIGQIMRALNARMILTHILWGLYAASLLAVLLLPRESEVVALTRLVSCAGMLGWAFLAWVEGDLRRMLVLAATSQFGFVVLGASLSSNVALSYLWTGSVALLVLFLLAYYFRRRLRTFEIDKMAGLAVKMPGAFVLFVLAALWLAGLPPFGSFLSKFLLGVAAGAISPLFSVAITGAAILTLSYLLRPIRRFLNSV